MFCQREKNANQIESVAERSKSTICINHSAESEVYYKFHIVMNAY